ncbi:hypothetical protein RF11_01867 [Thelohanellus kitauei]|uniref:Uncharacterized protein n=1 Tax=Thelohanellus kitauei TaxID=669202 RepID=A0A0C2J221_THEKT|nr:hypothetical protein RF11_01867 [Thelohanellus kitauei]
MNQRVDSDRIFANQRARDDYFWDTLRPDLSLQIKAVKAMMSQFSDQSDFEGDNLFIERFPEDLLEEFNNMSKGEKNINRYRKKKILLFDIFTFIFRNTNVLRDPKTRKFILIFLNFIKTREYIRRYNPTSLIGSVMICVSHEPNKILFINENELRI